MGGVALYAFAQEGEVAGETGGSSFISAGDGKSLPMYLPLGFSESGRR